jgi:hypothetical protein
LRHRARAAARQLEDAKSLIAPEVESAALNLEGAKARLEVTAEAVAEAEENLRMARELYGSGLATNTQVLDAESLRIGALTNRENARYDRSWRAISFGTPPRHSEAAIPPPTSGPPPTSASIVQSPGSPPSRALARPTPLPQRVRR